MKKLTHSEVLIHFQDGGECWFYSGESDENDSPLMTCISLDYGDTIEDVSENIEYFEP